MDKDKLFIFQREVERQCVFGLIAARDLQNAVHSRDLGMMDRIWYSVQAFLVATGNLSKLLWPSKKNCAPRGERLRASLGVPKDSPLRTRGFRNAFEHFDERLEEWLDRPCLKVIDSNVAPSGSIRFGSTADYLRNLDTTKGAITFRGEEYQLRPAVRSLESLHEACRQVIYDHLGVDLRGSDCPRSDPRRVP